MEKRGCKGTYHKSDVKKDLSAQTQLRQLLCALVLFLSVFLGKQIFPEKMVSVGGEVLAVLNQTTDFEGVFSQLGDALVGENGTLQGMEDFCLEVFGPRTKQTSPEIKPMTPKLPRSPVGILSEQLVLAESLAIYMPEPQEFPESKRVTSFTDTQTSDTVGSILIVGEPSQSLPDGYTANKLSLGGLRNVSPVLGVLTSPYGYRDHPVKDEVLFHAGVDISGNLGDPIAAFADGTVEYVGEDDSYGLYFQLDHGNGIKSFYAHCQEVCVRKGEMVRVGEQVAKVGASGTVTGPHLHLELKCGDLRIDPAYYIDILEI